MEHLEPGEAYGVCLDRDLAKPVADRRQFLTVVRNVREQRLLSERRNALLLVKTDAEYFDAMVNLFCETITGWVNMPQAFCSDAVQDLMSSGQMRELTDKILRNGTVNIEEKKESESQP